MSLCTVSSVGRTYLGPVPVHALVDIQFDVGPGELVAIEGPSGSGKSTLLNILGLLDRPTTGSYLLDGVDTTGANSKALASYRAEKIGFVFQSFHLLNQLPVVDNVALGGTYQRLSARERYGQALEALRRLGVDKRAMASPTTLSGGERQRVAIARALIGEKRLLLCDEPTGNLDRENSSALLEVLQEQVAEGVSVVVVTHDAQVAGAAQRRYRIEDGRIGEA